MKRVFSILFGSLLPMHAVPYGSFPSPISAEMLAQSSIQIRQVLVEEDEIYWIEARPEEGGRTVPVRYSTRTDFFKAPYYVRTQVHEYGGKCATFHEGCLYFSNNSDQNLYKATQEGVVTRITNTQNLRFADFVVHPNGKWLYTVLENHSDPKDVKNTLAKVDLDSGAIETIAQGHDFYGAPRISPDGTKLAYIVWDHPNMPWDKTELWLSDLGTQGVIESERKLAGMENESIGEPSWAPNNTLYFVSDRNGYWNLYNEENDPICELNADFTGPAWGLGNKSYTFITLQNRPHIAAIYTEKAIDSLALIDIEKHSYKKLPLDFTQFSDITTRKQTLVFIAKSKTAQATLVELDPISFRLTVITEPNPIALDPRFISTPETIEFPSLNGKTAFAFFYPPKNPNCTPNLSEKPPLIVLVHGGPTTHTTPSFKLGIQFWTSRGFSVCDVNYGGSTGFGREYRERLKGNWGVIDVHDVCAAANSLAQRGLVDPNRLAIEGGSSGGYTTLAALTFAKTFKVGVSYFGVSDLALLAQDTHKFESHYLDTLIGPYPAKESLYKERSPIYHADKLSCPVLFLQGGMDKIVPPNQAEKMYEILVKKKIPTAYLLFPEEAHGFRVAKNIVTSFEAELNFYRKIFKIASQEKGPATPIVNL